MIHVALAVALAWSGTPLDLADLRAAWLAAPTQRGLSEVLSRRAAMIDAAEEYEVRALRYEQAADRLFGTWSLGTLVAEVTLGLPDPQEQAAFDRLIKTVRADLPADWATDRSGRYMAAILDGLAAAAGDVAAAHTCLTASIEDVTGAVAVSRLARARLQAARCLGDVQSEARWAMSLQSLVGVEVEDLLAAWLSEISAALARDDRVAANRIWSVADARLVAAGRGDLRMVLASGYARRGGIDHRTRGWARLADALVAGGASRREIDAAILARVTNLNDPPLVTRDASDPWLAQVATRAAAHANLEAGRLAEALPDLLALAHTGDMEAAEALGMSLHGRDEAYPGVLADVAKCICNGREPTRRPRSWWGQVHAATLDDAARIEADLRWTALHACIAAVRGGMDREPLALAMRDAEAIGGPFSGRQLRQLGEAARLLGLHEEGRRWLSLAMEMNGPSIETMAALADCSRDASVMAQVARDADPVGDSAYWFWLANLRLVQWHLEDGGDAPAATARVNRLRLLDDELGGPVFADRFVALLGDG